jgi:polar amino acid transport system substrate-binding protein
MNEERQANALFSKPYMTNSVVIVVNEKSSINKLADLKGKKVAVQAGAPAATYVQNYQGAGFNAKMLKELVQYPDNAMAFYDLKKGGVDVVAVDEIFADYYIKTQKLRLRRLPDFIAKEQIGIAFRKNDTTLRDKVQEALDSMIKDGTAARISMKWFGRDVFSTHN